MDVATLEAAGKAAFPSLCRDTCTVKAPVAGSPDGFGGESDTLSTVASNIKCIVQPERDLPLMTQGGAVMGALRTKLFLELTDVDLQSIGPGWQIVVAARGNKGALTFEDPRRLDASVEVALTVSAKLKQ
jgi:hypothetical protein